MSGATEVASSWLLGKIAPAVGGLFGGLSLAMFWTPEKIREKGKIASVFIAGGISAMAGFAFTGLVAAWLSVDPNKIDVVIGLAWCLGLVSIAVMNWVANFMSRREHMDIAEVGREINAARKGQKVQPIRAKPRARKAVISGAVATKTTSKTRGIKA